MCSEVHAASGSAAPGVALQWFDGRTGSALVEVLRESPVGHVLAGSDMNWDTLWVVEAANKSRRDSRELPAGVNLLVLS